MRQDKYISQNHNHEEKEREADLMSNGEGGRSISRALVGWLSDKNENSPNSKKNAAAKRSLSQTLELLQNRNIDLGSRIQDTAEKLNTLEELRDLYQDGKLDFDNNEHLRKLHKTGLTQSEIEAQGLQAFDSRHRELIQYMNDLEEAQSKLDNDIDVIMNSDLADDEKQHQLDELYDDTDPDVLYEKAVIGSQISRADQVIDQTENEAREISGGELNLDELDKMTIKFNSSALGEELESASNDEQYNQVQPATGTDAYKP